MPNSNKILQPATPILAGVVGSPIAHSLSPLIHTIWAHRAGINGYYVPLEAPPTYEDFEKTMKSLEVIGFAGVNVTLPHKEHALRYATKASNAATLAGASNMLSFADNGVYADNSDISGFADAVKGKLESTTKLSSALVLGAGGAARGIVLALKSLGLTDIQITNRTRSKAETLGAEFGINVVDWHHRNDAMSDRDMIVNTTSLGMAGQPPLEIDLERLTKTAVVSDIVYAPLKTNLLKAAHKRGHLMVDGLDMLMHQAVPGFRAWFASNSTTKMAVVDNSLRAELVAALDRRRKKQEHESDD